MKKKEILIYYLITIIFFIFIYIIQPIIENHIKIITIVSILLVVGVFYAIKRIKKLRINYKDIVLIIMILGILIRAMYIIYTPITERQHDVYSINDQGHLGYIYTIYQTGKLPDTNSIQFYHPPLFHLIAAGWLKVNDIFNVELDRSIEGIQIITAIFSSLIMLVSYRIVEKIEIKNIYKILIMAVMAFHPTFIILAGSINNDVLMILLSFYIILYLIKWNDDPNIKNTIILAIITGCAVMTKVSGAIMAVPIMYTFIKKIFEIHKTEKDKLLRLFGKFLLFGVISLPLGLWHPIRNLILFNQKIGWVLLPADGLYVGQYSFFERFLTISFKEMFGYTYCVIPGDRNIFSYIVKTSILGEFAYNNSIGIYVALFKIINLIIISTTAICIFILLKKISNNSFVTKILLITFFMNIASYYHFNIKYPYLCTMDFRYIVPTIFTGIATICMVLDEFVKNDIIKELIEYMIILFCILSFTFFFII
mgnify:FL=1